MEKEFASNQKSIIKGTLLLTLSMLLVKVFGLIYKVPLSYILSDEGMGYFNTAYTVYTFFYVISTAGVPKAISILSASSNDEKSDRISSAAFRSFFTIGIILSIVFVFLASPIAKGLGSPKSHLSMLAIAPTIAFVCASGALRGYFNGKLKLMPLAISELIAGISKLVFGLFFAYTGEKIGLEIFEISAFSILGITVGSFLGFVYLYLTVKITKRSHKKVKGLNIRSDFSILKTILKISIPLTLTAAIGSLINLLDVALVMRMLRKDGFSELQANILYGNYTTLVVPMFNMVATLLAPVTAVLLPLLAKNSSLGNASEYESKTKISTDISIFITVPISFLFFYYSDSILSFVFEDASAKMAAPLLSALSPSVVFMGMLLIINTAIEGSGNYKLPLLSLTLGSLSKLLISGILIGNDNFNILAAPFGTVISYLISFFISYVYLNNVKKIKFPLFKTITISSLFSLIAITPSLFFHKYIDIKNWYLNEILSYGIFAILYFTLIIIYIFIVKKGKKVYNCDKNSQHK